MGAIGIGKVQRALEGTVLAGRYRLDRVVGSGGFGVVFAAHHLTLDVPVAVKVLHSEFATVQHRDDAFDRFVGEAKMLAQLRHPHIARVLDTGMREAQDGLHQLPWLVMEWCDGPMLSEYLANRSRAGLSRSAAWRLFQPIVDAVAHAHEQGVAHRDLKPDNIILVGNSPRVLDFGIAKVMTRDLPPSDTAPTRSTSQAFTPAYGAPEQFAALRTGPWTDVHALGLILTELLVGKRAYRSDGGAALISEALSDTRPTPDEHAIDVGPWEAVIARALAVEPTDRYPDAKALLDALVQTAPTLDTVHSDSDHTELDLTLPAPDKSETTPSSRRARVSWRVGLGIGIVSVAAGVTGWSVTREKPDVDPMIAVTASAAPSSVPAPIPTTHPFDDFSTALIAQRVEHQGWKAKIDPPRESGGEQLSTLRLSRGDQRGNIIVFRAKRSTTIDISIETAKSSPDTVTTRRGAALMHVQVIDDRSAAEELARVASTTEDPKLPETPEAVPGSPWRRKHVPAGADLNAIWGNARGQLLIVGDHGVVLRRDGERWLRDNAAGHDLHAVWGRNATEVYVGGAGGYLARWSGEAWKREDLGTDEAVFAIVGTREHVVAVCGNSIVEREGDRWVATQLEDHTGLATAYTDGEIIYVVGIDGVVHRREKIGRYKRVASWPDVDGMKWPVIRSGFTSNVNPTAAPWLAFSTEIRWSAKAFTKVGNDVFLVGTSGAIVKVEQALVPAFEPSGTQETLNAIWQAKDKTLWVAGDRGTVLERPAPR